MKETVTQRNSGQALKSNFRHPSAKAVPRHSTVKAWLVSKLDSTGSLHLSCPAPFLAHTWQAQTAFEEHASNDQGGEKGVGGHILSVPQARTWASTEESWVSTMEWMMDCG